MVGRRLRAAGRRGKTVSVTVVYRPEDGHFSRQVTLPRPVATGDDIYQAARKLLEARDSRRMVGTLGVGLSGLIKGEPAQMDLFIEPVRPRLDRLEAAVDSIRDRFGEDAIQRSRLLGRASVVRDRIAFGNTGHPDEK
jgi:DNA polymerase IV